MRVGSMADKAFVRKDRKYILGEVDFFSWKVRLRVDCDRNQGN